MNKLETRRIQMLVRQREQLEEEMAALQKEVDTMVLTTLIPSKIYILTLVTGIGYDEEKEADIIPAP